MSLEGNVEYASVRVQSQFGDRADASEWRRLEASHDLGQYLEAARSSFFGPWIASLDRDRSAHDIERALRSSWRSYVRTVAAWHPRHWQPWFTWLEWLPTLGLIARLKSADTLPAWLMADPVVGPAVRGVSVERPVAVKGTALAFFEPAIAGRVPLENLWLAHWRALLPPADAFTQLGVAAVSKAVQECAQALAIEGADAAVLRDQLRQTINRLFRATAGTPVATLCHLILTALDFEQLRGGLVNRSLFAGRG
jgi:hypothetical protein